MQFAQKPFWVWPNDWASTGRRVYKVHPHLEKPNNENASVWRYMEFTKFVSLLDRNELFFARDDKLGDPFEGSVPKINRNRRLEKFSQMQTKNPELMSLTYGDFRRIERECTAVNCWHMNAYESAAMWERYANRGDVIAIRSTFNLLKNSIVDNRYDFCLAKVTYLNYDKDAMPEFAVSQFYHKMKIFRYEREVRAVVQELPRSATSWRRAMDSKKKRPFQDGIYVKVNLEKLIRRVYIAPGTPAWLLQLVESVITKYGLKKEVFPSRLDEKPIF